MDRLIVNSAKQESTMNLKGVSMNPHAINVQQANIRTSLRVFPASSVPRATPPLFPVWHTVSNAPRVNSRATMVQNVCPVKQECIATLLVPLIKI